VPCNLTNLCREFGLAVDSMTDEEIRRLGHLIIYDPVVSELHGLAVEAFRKECENDDFDVYAKALDAMDTRDFATEVVRAMAKPDLKELRARILRLSNLTTAELCHVQMLAAMHPLERP
jgi:hypothetical protein